MTWRQPWAVSVGLHGLLVLAFTLLSITRLPKRTTQTYDFDVVQVAKPSAAAVNLEKPLPPKAPPKTERAVFGVSRQAIVTDSADSAEIKAGNTVAKEDDQLKLEPGDADRLPIPADEFLVTSMPRLKTEYRIPYPIEAKKAGIEGPVVMDLLIDAEGRVRQAQLIRGPGYGLNEAALDAVKRFEFAPARIQNENVAVRIKYTYRFVLEGS